MFKLKNNPHLKSDFLKNVFTLLSGATVAQIITLISIPILTRIYTPEDFGYIAIYLSIANIVAAFSTGRYELAIMLPKKRIEALAIFKGSFKIAVIVPLTSLVAIIFLKIFDHKINYFPFQFSKGWIKSRGICQSNSLFDDRFCIRKIKKSIITMRKLSFAKP